MCKKRNDLTPLADAFTRVIIEAVRFGLERIEPLGNNRGAGRGLLTRKQTADRLRMSLTTLHERRKSGLLLPVDDDGRTVYREADVDNFIRRLKQMKQLE